MHIFTNRPRLLGCIVSAAILGTFSTAPAQVISTVAGTGSARNNSSSGAATKVNVGQPFGVEIGPQGDLYITEVQNHRILRVNLKTGQLHTVVGTGTKGYSGDGGPASKANLNEPYEVRFDHEGNMYFVEMMNHIIRKVDLQTQVIQTIAGTGEQGFGGDGGPATKAKFSRPHSIALDGQGGLYVADIGNHRIRKINLETGVVTTIAGNGKRIPPVDGQLAAGNPLIGPRALFVRDNTLWIALREGHSVWKMSLSDGVLHHVAGTGQKGFGGDGGPAKQAKFNGPKGIALGPDQNVYVVDTENQTIRKIDTSKHVVTTVAGVGPKHRGGAGDGQAATRAQLDRPHGICVGSDGTIYIGDTNNHRVRKVK